MTIAQNPSKTKESPWDKAVLRVDGEIVDKGAKIVMIRGGETTFSLEIPEDVVQELRLGLGEDGGLQVGAIPEFTSWVKPVGGRFSWKIKPEDGRSGSISLVFYTREPNPSLVASCLVISADLSDEVEEVMIKAPNLPGLPDIPVAPFPKDGIVFFRNENYDIHLKYKPGSPLEYLRVKLDIQILTGSPIKVVEPSDFTIPHSWRVRLHTHSGTVKLTLIGDGMTQDLELPICKVMSRYLWTEADVEIDDKPVPATGFNFIKGKPERVTLRPKPGSPLGDHGVKMNIIWSKQGEMGSFPQENSVEKVHVWTLTPRSDHGEFRLNFVGNDMNQALVTPTCRWLPSSVSAYFDVLFDGKPLPDGQKPMLTRYGLQTFTLKPKSGMAIPGRVGLRWGTPPIGVKMDPDNAVPQDVHPVDGVTWTLRCLDVDGEFSVRTVAQWASEQLEIPMSVTAGEYKLTFSLYGSPMPYPPAVVPALSANPKEWPRATPRITVTTQTGVPVPGVWVTFVSPDYADGHGQSDHLGSALSSQVVQYFKEGIVELVAKVTGATGRVSMMRILIDHIYRS